MQDVRDRAGQPVAWGRPASQPDAQASIDASMAQWRKQQEALIAKYGPPDSTTEPIRMRWNAPKINDLYLSAECGGTEGPLGDFCIVQAYDGPLLESERSTGDRNRALAWLMRSTRSETVSVGL